MAAAGAVVAAALRAVREAAGPGVSTKDLDDIAETVIREADGIPSFLGYHGYPASICSSVNDRVVHGIPTADEKLAAGDLVLIGDAEEGQRVRPRVQPIPSGSQD